ncbi:hypothetical protein LOTGIDRAFT_164301 [Lottia gigantea]|uniref:Gamma-glutamylcyclotransferase n=1 Tax=Lottia gigantea TaxID=225164 RepID=V4BNF3_LOTGI|nr:hypothetical protein LOTGIDRAFT_164301 [Lottia gigantea]ESO90374.1 hypothetical protein LOTGIDRAFT_164301 [Lottia gigantea]
MAILTQNVHDVEYQDALLRTFNTDIEDKAGNTYNCLVFEMVNGDHPGEAPSPQYKDVIVRGAKRSGLPEHYIQFLESFQDNGYNGPHLLYQQIIDNLDNDNNNIKICNDNGEN